MTLKTGPESILVQAAREAAGLTQAQAAEVVHVSTNTWSTWETSGARARRMPLGLFELFEIKTKAKAPKRVGKR